MQDLCIESSQDYVEANRRTMVHALRWKTQNTIDLRIVSKKTISKKKGVPSAESPRSVRGLGKGVSDKPYPRLCNARRPRLEPGTFRSQAVRLYRLHQARPSKKKSKPKQKSPCKGACYSTYI